MRVVEPSRRQEGESPSPLAWAALGCGVLAFLLAAILLVPSLLDARHFIVSIPAVPYWDQFHTVVIQRIQGVPPYLGEGRRGPAVGGHLWLYKGIAALGAIAFVLAIVSLVRRRGWMAWVGLLLAGLALVAFFALLPWVLDGLAYS